MSLFISLAAKVTHVAYLGLILPVPTEYVKDGYIAADLSGEIWAFESIPTIEYPASNSAQWNNGAGGATRILVADFFEELGEKDWFVNNWKNTCIKLSELPVIT